MPLSLSVWSICVQPGEDGVQVITPPADIRITNIALSDELADQSGRSTVKLNYTVPGDDDDDEEEEEEDDDEDDEKPPRVETTVLCSLTPGKIEQATVDVVLTQDDEFLIEVVGKNSVYLSGNYIDQSPDDVPYNDESEPDSDEEDFDLRDVSSDVEMDPAALDDLSDDHDRFEEIIDEPESAPASKKRPRDSDQGPVETPEKLTKAQKKANKKLKVESGASIPSGSDAKPDVVKASGEASNDKKDKKEKSKKLGDATGQPTNTKTLEGGIQITDVTVGKGPQAKKGNTVNMRYIGKLANGKIFDSNTKGKPFSFTLGKGEVIKGWDIGIAGMQVGGERLLVIPPKMGYGNRKSGPIPPNSTLTFEVKMVDVK